MMNIKKTIELLNTLLSKTDNKSEKKFITVLFEHYHL
ncbi:MAG: hypothetical protein ACI83H_001170 [Glaciecola sp.]|jgi:hypothetical protein